MHGTTSKMGLSAINSQYHLERKRCCQLPGERTVELNAGVYEYSRMSRAQKRGYHRVIQIWMCIRGDEQAKGILMKYAPGLLFIHLSLQQGTLKEVMCNAFSEYTKADYEKIVKELRELS